MNNIKKGVYVGWWMVAINSAFSDPEGRAYFVIDEVIDPGGVRTLDREPDNSPSNMEITNEMPTEQQKSDWLSKYGCKAESGITEDDTMNFVVGSSEGMYPLKKDIRW